MRDRAPSFFPILSAALLFSAIAASGALFAQSPLEVVDASGAYVGPVVTIVPTSSQSDFSRYLLFLYDSGGEYALLSAVNPAGVNSCLGGISATAYYESASCSGAPALVKLPGDGSLNCQFFPIVLPDGGGPSLWEVNRDQPVQLLVAGRKSLGNTFSNFCEALTPEEQSGLAVTLWGSFDFEFPLEVRRNPFIFGDDFSSSSLEAWSNH